MANFLSEFWMVLKLDIQSYEKIKNDKTGLWLALRLFLVVALLSTIGALASTLTTQRPGVTAGLENIVAQSQAIAARLPVLSESFTRIAQAANGVAAALEKYQPPLGKPASNFLRGIGEWLSMPLSLLGVWMSAALAVFITAKLFKGKGEIREHFSLFLLGFTPQILALVSGFSFLNSILGVVGGLLNFAAWIWSLAIVIVALDVIHGFGKGKAFLVVVLSFLIFYVLIPFILSIPLVLGILTRLR